MLRYFSWFLGCDAVFGSETVTDEAFEFGDSSGRFEALGQIGQLRLLDRRANALAQPVGALMSPPIALRVARPTTSQLFGAVPFQVHKRRQRQFRPAFHAGELLELVLMKTERGLQFLEEQLSVPIIIPPKITLLSSWRCCY